MSQITATLSLLESAYSWLLERQQLSSAATSLNQVPRAIKQLDAEGVWKAASSALDLGAGKYDTAKKFLSQRGVRCHCYDPYNRPEAENKQALNSGKHDVVMLNNVLNVIREPEERDKLIRLAKEHVKVDGMLVVQVYAGDGSGDGKQTGDDQYQLNQPLSFYEPALHKHFGSVEVKGGLLRARISDASAR